MRRRTVLSAIAALAFGGCLGVTRDAPARLAWIWLVNDRDEAHAVDVVVKDAGDTVFSRTFHLRPASSPSSTVTTERPVDGFGDYIVRATTDDGATRAIDTRQYVDGTENCIGVRFSLLDNGSFDYWTKSMERC